VENRIVHTGTVWQKEGGMERGKLGTRTQCIGGITSNILWQGKITMVGKKIIEYF
jgi:hypothetical protein